MYTLITIILIVTAIALLVRNIGLKRAIAEKWQELQEHENYFNELGDGFITCNTGLRVTSMNTVAEEMIGLSALSVIGKDLSEMAKVKNTAALLQEILHTGSVVVGMEDNGDVKVHSSKDSNGSPMNVHTLTQRDRISGKVLGYVKILRKKTSAVPMPAKDPEPEPATKTEPKPVQAVSEPPPEKLEIQPARTPAKKATPPTPAPVASKPPIIEPKVAPPPIPNVPEPAQVPITPNPQPILKTEPTQYYGMVLDKVRTKNGDDGKFSYISTKDTKQSPSQAPGTQV